MLAKVVPYLVCPRCASEVNIVGSAVRCSQGHSYDVARQGYVNLLDPATTTAPGDTAEMVAARERFLAGGHYAAIASSLADEVVATMAEGCVVDLGAGPATYLAAVLNADGSEGAGGRDGTQVGLALDVSRHAARRAARAHPRIGAVVADTWRPLPIRTGCAAVVLDVFAPRNAGESARILADGGALLVVTPTATHLTELVGPLGLLAVDARKDDRVEEQLRPQFRLDRQRAVEAELVLDRDAVRDLVGMGPSAWHTDAASLQDRLAGLPDPVRVTMSVTVGRWHHR